MFNSRIKFRQAGTVAGIFAAVENAIRQPQLLQCTVSRRTTGT